MQEKSEKKIALGRHSRTWEDIFKMDLQKVRWRTRGGPVG